MYRGIFFSSPFSCSFHFTVFTCSTMLPSATPGTPTTVPHLFDLAKSGSLPRLVSLLDEQGVNIHAVSRQGFNLMMIAAQHRRPEILRWTIAVRVGRGSGVDRKERKEGLTSLMMACLRWSLPGHYLHGAEAAGQDTMECAAILVANGANVLQADNLGRTCLHLAVLAGLPNIIRFLCTLPQAPVLVQVKDGEGKLPADYLTSDVNLAGYQEASAAVRRVRTLVGLASMVFF
jgi:hypothetical protein